MTKKDAVQVRNLVMRVKETVRIMMSAVKLLYVEPTIASNLVISFTRKMTAV